jgi:hypothetical protein
VDGDGGVDLVLGDGRYYSVASGYPTSGSLGSLDAVDLALVDMDGDGLDDVITSGVAGLQVHVNAGGSLLPAIDIDPNITAASLQLADVDEDGDLDLLATRPNLTWYENDGLLSIPTPALLGGSANAVRMGDLDGDGMGDLVVAAADPGSGGSAISWHRGLGGGLFEAPVSIWSIATPDINAVELADFDGDGDLDIASGQDERGLAFLDNLGGAVFAPVRETGVTTVIGLVVADIDGDGDLDLFARSSWTQDGTCACCAGGGTVEWYENRWCLGDGDGDGICDDLDPCPLDNPDDPDGDGLCGLTAPCLPDGTADSDWDGLPDSCDWCPDDWGNDSDQDGVCDLFDLCPGSDDGLDADLDGRADGCDGCPFDVPAEDDDLDGICDSDDVCQGNDITGDTDGDGLCDDRDICPLDATNDSDLDGTCDSVDACPGEDDRVDSDDDGVADGCDGCPFDPLPLDDVDSDGVCNSVDLCDGDDALGDWDSDGVCDDLDPCPQDPLDDGDGDGSCDSADLCVGDDTTGDPDGDHVCSDSDPCPEDVFDDSDQDGVCDGADICPGGDDAKDQDEDGMPDFCDGCKTTPGNACGSPPPIDQGCGCATSGRDGLAWWPWMVLALVSRRRAGA